MLLARRHCSMCCVGCVRAAFCGGKMFRACQLQSINQLWMLQRLLQRSPTRQLRSALGSVQHLQSIACFVVCGTRYQLAYIVAVREGCLVGATPVLPSFGQARRVGVCGTRCVSRLSARPRVRSMAHCTHVSGVCAIRVLSNRNSAGKPDARKRTKSLMPKSRPAWVTTKTPACP